MSKWSRPYCANRHFSWQDKSNISKRKFFIVDTHTHLWVLEISASTLLGKSCAPLLGARVLCTLLCARIFLVVKEFLLNIIEKDLVGFFSLIEKGFPGYILCTFSWCFFLWYWFPQHSCLWLRHDEIEMNYMLNLAYGKSTKFRIVKSD